jgi:glycosyltransferase involved in cell wall biosynthesis
MTPSVSGPGIFAAVPAPHKILVVGQTPPPFGGQSVMIAKLLEGHYQKIRLYHVRLAFSEDMDSVGKFAFKKIWILFTTILRIWIARFRHGARAMYYPPSGPNKVPVLRDIILLCSTRWLFRHVIFHFHAGGVSTFQAELPSALRPLFRRAYQRPALAIRTAPHGPDDGRALGAIRNVVVPNGVEDMRGRVPERVATGGDPLVFLFTGVLIESKGVFVLLQAFRQLLDRGVNARLEIMGRWGDPGFERHCMHYITGNDLAAKVDLLGVKKDREKFIHFAGCDIFCFPSFFEAESFGLVLVEAMQFAKPVIGTMWRGIPSVVHDGVNGFLVPVQDPQALAIRMLELAADAELRRRMGAEGRRIFEQNFTLETFHRSMERELASVFE